MYTDNRVYHFEEGVTTPIQENHRGPFLAAVTVAAEALGDVGSVPGMVALSPQSSALVVTGSP